MSVAVAAFAGPIRALVRSQEITRRVDAGD
jgi:hypothetical protein